MKTKTLIVAAMLTVAAALAQTNTQPFSFLINNGVVLDADFNGFSDTQSITVSNTAGSVISEVRVLLNLTGGYNGDLYAYLTHGSGFAVLLNRAGRTSGNLFGYGDAGFNITLADSAATDIHVYGGNGGLTLTGPWQPDGRNVNPAGTLDADLRTTPLSLFNSLDANGAWTLFLADLSGGQQSTLAGWGLELTTIPEPTTWMLLGLGAVMAAARGMRWSRRRAAGKSGRILRAV